MRCPNCQSKNRKKARFCRVCGHRLLSFCPSCGTSLIYPSSYCDHCGFRLSGELAVAADSFELPKRRSVAVSETKLDSPEKEKSTERLLSPDELIQQFIPKELARKLETVRSSGTMSGERRIVTMLFCDVKGSTAAAVNLDPEEWTEIINEAFGYMIKPVYKYEGTVARLMGDGILAFFGAPIGHEDDPQRAVLAGLEIVSGIAPYRDSIKEKHGLDFDIRVGINTGRVVVGAVGSDLRMEYTAMGDAINIAARMEQTAEPGTVQITEETRRLIAPLFVFESLGGIEVKGRDEPVPAFRVIGRTARPGRLRGIEGLEAPLIGRDSEWQRLLEAAEAVKKGVGQIVFLVGEAGLGKSRLIRELQLALEETISDSVNNPAEEFGTPQSKPSSQNPGITLQWFETASHSYESAQPYSLFQRLARRVAGIGVNDSQEMMREKLEMLVSALPETGQADGRRVFESLFSLTSRDGNPPLEGESFKGQLYTVTESLWQQRAKKSPVVLVVDDLHWADTASIALLEYLYELSESVPVLFISALRPDRKTAAWELRSRASQRYSHRTTDINVRPLTAKDSDLLINNLLTISDLPLAMRENIIAKAEGNPFFVEEVIRTLIDGGEVLRDESGSHWVATGDGTDIEIPDNLQSLLTSRIDKLDEEPRRVLQLASLIGRSFYFRVLERVFFDPPASGNGHSLEGNGRLGQHLSTLLQADLIREAARIPELEYAFIHALTQEATYRTILRKLRRDYHLRVGEVIEQLFPDQLEEHAPMLARHFLEAEDKERAARYFTMAGDVALRLYSLSSAVDHYTQAISLLDPIKAESSQLVYLYGRRGRALELDDAFEEAMNNYLEMERLAEEKRDENLKLASLQARTVIHAIFSPLYDPEKALQLAEEALVLAHQQDDHAVQAKVLWSLMLVHGYGLSDMETAMRYGQQSLKLARQYDLEEQLPFILNDLGRITSFQGYLNEGKRLIIEARKLFRKAGNLALLQDNLSGYAMMAAYSGDLTGGLEAAEEALRVSRSINNIWGMSVNSRFAAIIGMELGYIGQAASEIARLMEADESDTSSPLAIELLPAYTELGATDLSVRILDEKANFFENSNLLFKILYQGRVIRTYLSANDVEAAEKAADSMELDINMKPIPPMHVVAFFAHIELALARGNPEKALMISRRLNGIIEEYSMKGFKAENLMLEAQCLLQQDPSQKELARTALEQASLFAGQIGQKRVAWKAHLALAELSEEPEATELRQKAREIVEWIAVGVKDPVLRESFLQQSTVRKLITAEKDYN